MTEVRVRIFTSDFGTRHEKLRIRVFYYIDRIDRLREARPSCPTIVLIFRREEWRPVDDIDIDTFFVIIPVFILISRLCTILLGYFILKWGEFFLEIILREFLEFLSPVLFYVPRSTTSLFIEMVAKGRFFIVVLMVVLGWEKIPKGFYLDCNGTRELIRILKGFLRRFSNSFLTIIAIEYSRCILRSAVIELTIRLCRVNLRIVEFDKFLI